ncbi:putative acylesterase/phospholipase RssA [Flavobacterium sp. PL11]|uniref:patatin-like phospholipase family protein n=1 Tax=Flavobacterium sp. PL11 TaxID=3071717 RepID=UPI002E05CA49|nr:putative acylesterase/phospholipase RssA [Flavobacterium sp. PL11]
MENKTFRIGICMAGAVSAGAYTAGVMDYLMEALREWEEKKGQPNIPSHKVVIPVMGGASAGGMTALLTATTLNNEIVPVDLPNDTNLLDEHPENKLYHSWVDLVDKDMFRKMLDTSDISSGNVVALLNSDFIDDIATNMIQCDGKAWKDAPTFFEMPVKIFATLSNLNGFKYNINFSGYNRKEKYNMTVHNDYACFELFDDSTTTPSTPGWMPLNFKTGSYVKTAREAAMATGAFPIGLKSRIVEREAIYVNAIPWLKDIFQNTPIEKEQKTLNVDGGMINNEPFEKVRDILDTITIEQNKLKYNALSRDQKQECLNEINTIYKSFENTVLMIDPFPSTDKSEFDYSQNLTNILSKTFSAMTAQMRAKPLNYRSAMEQDDASQFIISPSRKREDNEGVLKDFFGEKAIACGTMGGFGGFLNKEFRIHDYFLGKYNCEMFLRKYFTIPEEALEANLIFAEGYRTVDKSQYVIVDSNGKRSYPIIPIFKSASAADSFPIPTFSCGGNWPKVNENFVDQYQKPIKNRAEKIILNIVKLSPTTHFFLKIGSFVVLNKIISKKVVSSIKDSLHKWNLVNNYKPNRDESY